MTENIAFIICYDDERYLEECIYYINGLRVPKGMEIDILGIKEAASLAEGYNAAMLDSDARYKIYIDQRTFIISDSFLTDVIKLFQENPLVGMMGICGSHRESKELNRGRMLIWGENKINEINFQKTERLESVCSLGSMLVATQYDLEWCGTVEEQCHRVRKRGYDVVVPHQAYSWCLYDCRNGFSEAETEYGWHLCRTEMRHDMESAKLVEQLLENGIISYEEHMQRVESIAFAETIMGYFWEDFLLSGKKRSKYLPANGNIWMEKEKNRMNIAAAFNHNYAKYAMVMLQSLYENNQLCKVYIHILQCELTEKDKQMIAEQAKSFENEVIFYEFDRTWLPKGIKVTTEWSIEAYFRLYMVDLLPEWIDRILYLDVDIIVNKPIYDYYFMDMKSYDMVACRDFSRVLNEQFSDKRKFLFDEISGEEAFVYFNSGVMLMDMDRLRRKVKGADYLKIAGELEGRLLAPDQDILNIVHWKDTGLVDEWRFDFFNACLKGLKPEEANQQASIIHYAGPKPWMPIDINVHAHRIWWKYAKNLPQYSKIINILFIRQVDRTEREIIKEFQNLGCRVTEYSMCKDADAEYAYLSEKLQRNTYHFICSVGFNETLAHAGYSSGTKYAAIQPDVSAQNLFSVYITYATNYIFLYDDILFKRFRAEGFQTVYLLESNKPAGEIIQTCFVEEEKDIYETILDLERWWKKNGRPEKEKNYFLEEVYRSFDSEKKFYIPLKEKVMRYINKLLAKRSISGWEEILVWYNRNGVKELRGHFWEFYLFSNILSIYWEEREIYYAKGQNISVLNFESMEEIFSYYFKLIFLLRRIEYDILPETYFEVCTCIHAKSVSDVFLQCVIKKGQIENKSKVEKKLRELLEEYKDG